ncbi:DnaJ C-terminal domain-containing protein [Litorihabitans aurantiacus]|uniref:Molecular chaperone DnaJ n=1 Tax=Litorihabitans aurantiacus TaxID=1930061 RepID=A0AA37XGU2_9MICO|nr:DnaJ C-terminal domain-containing protein [Litorihabitans aurantiacus]GMA32632.1 molecular chaperone DnaJ [Litorihabitans aurantiacus]
MSGQDWLEKDFYAMLGVPKDADDAAVKKAYRKLARTHHPDQNPGDAKAEARFKEIGEAYAVLSDPEQRKQYDGLRAMAGGGPRFTAGAGGAGGGASFEDLFGGVFGGGQGAPGGAPGGGRFGGAGAGSFEDILSGMFGGGAPGAGGPGGRRRAGFGGPEQGADLNATLTLPFRLAVEGGEMPVSVEGRSTTVRIPAGVRDGQKIRLRGKGRPGQHGGAPGDLMVAVTVSPHPVFSIDGANLALTVPVTFAEAALGATITVPTFDGGSVRVRVPEGSPSGKRLRVRGKGVRSSKGDGDLIVTIQVAVPERLSDAARAAVEAFAEATADADPRSGLAGSAAH